MTLKTADARNDEILSGATTYAASLFLGRGKYANASADTLDGIKQAAAKLSTDNPKIVSKPIITAFDAAGNSAIVGAKAKAAKKAKKPAATKAALKNRPVKPVRPVKAPKAAPAPVPAPIVKAPKKGGGKRAQVQTAAEAGTIPAAPDFSAATHKRFLKKHAELVALVEAGDIKALRSYAINPVSSSPKALDKYRNLAVIALEARQNAAK